jgi:hypothetical protein
MKIGVFFHLIRESKEMGKKCVFFNQVTIFIICKKYPITSSPSYKPQLWFQRNLQ